MVARGDGVWPYGASGVIAARTERQCSSSTAAAIVAIAILWPLIGYGFCFASEKEYLMISMPRRRRSVLFAIFGFLMLVSTQAFAEGGCPDGMLPTHSGDGQFVGCAPAPSSGGGASTVYSGPQWAKRWGAIAVDRVDGKFGGVDGLGSKRSAQKAAIADCKKNGGIKCKVELAYYNQCGVLAWGDNYFLSAGGPDINETSRRAVNLCGAKTPNCKPYYAGCSYPERVR
jgi:hypothetical protein